jgi:hypothetical protein
LIKENEVELKFKFEENQKLVSEDKFAKMATDLDIIRELGSLESSRIISDKEKLIEGGPSQKVDDFEEVFIPPIIVQLSEEGKEEESRLIT